MTRVRSLAGGLEPVCWPTVPADCRGELISENSIDKLVSGVGKKSESVCADHEHQCGPHARADRARLRRRLPFAEVVRAYLLVRFLTWSAFVPRTVDSCRDPVWIKLFECEHFRFGE
jgi:hypothetical protein